MSAATVPPEDTIDTVPIIDSVKVFITLIELLSESTAAKYTPSKSILLILPANVIVVGGVTIDVTL